MYIKVKCIKSVKFFEKGYIYSCLSEKNPDVSHRVYLIYINDDEFRTFYSDDVFGNDNFFEYFVDLVENRENKINDIIS